MISIHPPDIFSREKANQMAIYTKKITKKPQKELLLGYAFAKEKVNYLEILKKTIKTTKNLKKKKIKICNQYT